MGGVDRCCLASLPIELSIDRSRATPRPAKLERERARAACRRRVMPEDLVRLSTAHLADSVAQPLQPSAAVYLDT